MIEGVTFTEQEGIHDRHEVTVYALSTCGFCKKALDFLRYHKVKFRYVYVDMLNFDVKQDLKNALADRYRERVVFPFIIVDENTCSAGFVEEQWRKILSL